MGCEQGGREPQREGEEPFVESEKVRLSAPQGFSFSPDHPTNPDSDTQDKRLSIIVSLMLSSQTKDPVTHQVRLGPRWLDRLRLC